MRSGPASAVEDLIKEQSGSWPLLVQSLQGLHDSRTRRVRIDWYDVLIRHIPHRIASTTAKVDAASIQKRACFLCRSNLPPEEKGVALDSQFTAYCNPFPILEKHLTIVHNDHRPQAIAGFVGALLHLTQVLPGYFLIYNGPECGASAPDHMHFQACAREVFPIEQDAKHAGLFIPRYGRRVFVLRDTDAVRVAARLERLISVLADITGKRPEPLINIAGFYEAGWTLFVFPRSRHRPHVYETGELTVSPATIDLSGVFVVPKSADFDRITADDVLSIFGEVTLGEEAFNSALNQLEAMK